MGRYIITTDDVEHINDVAFDDDTQIMMLEEYHENGRKFEVQ